MKVKFAAIALFVAFAVVLLWWRDARGSHDVAGVHDSASDLPDSSAHTVEMSPHAEAAGAQSQRVAVASAPDTTHAAPATQVADIEVRAIDSSGVPQKGIEVWFDQGPDYSAQNSNPDGAKAVHIRSSGKSQLQIPEFAIAQSTLADGLARFRIADPSDLSRPAQVSLIGDKTAGFASLPAPLVSTHLEVTMLPCARVEVSVLDSAARPRPDAFVDVTVREDPTLSTPPPPRRTTGQFLKTDQAGLAVFDDVLPGSYEFSCRDASTNARVVERLSVELNQHYFVELRLSPDPTLRLCVAGTVVDESGNPLPKIKVRLTLDGVAKASVTSDEHGAFSHSCASGSEVELSAGGGMFDDDFEPSPVRVPFGTKDVRLRRARVPEVISVEFVFVDATSGEVIPVERLSGARYRAGVPKDLASFLFVAKGRTSLMFKAHDDWHVVVNAYGYFKQDIALADSMTHDADGDKVVVRFVRTPKYNADIDRDQ